MIINKKIAVIGAGFSGLMTAVHLSGSAQYEISLIGTEDDYGRGVAYSVKSDAFLLNVPAVGMGAYPDKADHFYKWLNENNYSFEATDFVPRRLYGEYLLTILEQAKKRAAHKLHEIKKAVIRISKSEQNKFLLTFTDNTTEIFDLLVLALGFPRQKFSLLNPHQESSYENLLAANSVAIIGSGLTAVDVIERCRMEGFEGQINIISRSAKFPYPHAKPYPENVSQDIKAGDKLTKVAKELRRVISKYGIEAALDPLRAITNSIWAGFADRDKRIFYRHLESRWNRIRHRMPPKGHEYIQTLIQQGRLVLHSGSVHSVKTDNKFEITIKNKNSDSIISADKAFDCRGPSPSAKHHPLIQQLLADGLVKTGIFERGLSTDSEGKVMDQEIFVTGPYRREQLLESTAVRELRQQAKDVADSILVRLG